MTWEKEGKHHRDRSIGGSRMSKEDLALFQDLAMRDDLDTALAMDIGSLTGYRASSRRGIGSDLLNSDTDKNDYDWLITPPDTPLSPGRAQTVVVTSRTLSAIKTSRNSGNQVEQVGTGPRRNPSPTRSTHGTSQSPRPNASTLQSNRRSSPHHSRPSTPGRNSHDPVKPSTPRLSTSHRPSTPTMRPSTPTSRSTSTIRATTATSKHTTSAAKSSSHTSTKSPIISTITSASSTARRSSPASNRAPVTLNKTTPSVTSSRVTPASPRVSTHSVARGSSPPVSNRISSRGSSPVRNGISRGTSPVRGSKSPARGPSPARIPSPTARRPSPPKGPSKPILAYDFLSETPANLRTTSVHSRGIAGPGALSRSTDGISGQNHRRHSTSPSNYQNQGRGPNSLNTSQDRGPMSLSKSQDRGPISLSRSQDRDPMSLSKSQDRGPNFGSKSQDRGSNSYSSQPRRATLDEQSIRRKVTIPEYGLDGRRLSTGSRDVPETSRPSLAKRTTLQQDSGFENSAMTRSSNSTASRSVGFSTQPSSLNSSGGFKPFMTNSSIPSFYNAIPSMSLHRKLHQMDSEPPLSPSSPSESGLSGVITPISGKSPVKKPQLGYDLKKEGVRLASHGSENASRTFSHMESKSKVQDEAATQTGYPPGLTSLVGGQGHVKIYKGLGDMEDMGSSWCCGMEDQCRSFCKKHDCGIYKKFHNALVFSSPEVSNHSVSNAADGLKGKQDEREDVDAEREKEIRSTGVFSGSRNPSEVKSLEHSGSPNYSQESRSPTSGSINRAVTVIRSREFLKVGKDEKLSDSESGSSTVTPHQSGQVSPVQYHSPSLNGTTQESSPGWDKEDRLRPSISYAAEQEVGRRHGSRERAVRRHSPLKPHDSVRSQGFSRSGSATPEDTSPLDVRAPASTLRGQHRSRQKKIEHEGPNGSQWDLEIVESSRHRQLKSPDFFDVTKRNGDGGMITAVSRVQNFSSPILGDPKVGDGDGQRPSWMVERRKDDDTLNPKYVDSEPYHVPHNEGEVGEENPVPTAKSSDLKRGSATDSGNSGRPISDLDLEPDEKSSDLLEDNSDEEDQYFRNHGLDLNGAEEDFVDILEDTHGGPLRHPSEFHSSTDEDSKKSPPAEEKPSRFSRITAAGYGGGVYKRSEVSRGSVAKSAISRISSTSATSIDLTRSTDTTCSAHSQYDNALWDDPLYSSNRSIDPRPWDPKSEAGPDQNVAGILPPPAIVLIEPQVAELPSTRQGAGATQSGSKISRLNDGLEKLAGYMRSASQNARKRRGLSEAEDLSSQESCFDYFVDFLESQTSLDLEGLEPSDITDALVSAHGEARITEAAAPPAGHNLTLMKTLDSRLSNNSLVSDKSVESRITDASSESSWESSKSRTVQTLGNSGQVMEQIMESVNSLASDSPKYLSSFKFGQKKTAAGALENITTLEVGLELGTTESGRKYSKQLSKASSEPTPEPQQQKIPKQLSKAQSWKTMSPVVKSSQVELTPSEERGALVGHPLPTPGSLRHDNKDWSRRGEELGGEEARVSQSASGNYLTESRAEPNNKEALEKVDSMTHTGSEILNETPKEMLMTPPRKTKEVRFDVADDDEREAMRTRHASKGGCGCNIL